ncbi:MAG TPA: amidohydrolase family protein [Acidimicrobiales bacterium]|jgi:predicted TIM-barrel fold metal-dependent hydrolase|nr:amidohydrolase family protein [Acidimicrobiales bacterium]
MPYAEGRVYYDADSHLMETSGWLVEYADPDIRDRIRPLYLGGAGKLADEAVRDADRRRTGEVTLDDIESGLLTRKGWSAYGAFDHDERSRALDLLGFDKQLVFSTFAPTQFLDDDFELLYGGTRAHNRAMADFCHHDDRLIAVGFVPLQDADRAVNAVEEALAFGCGAILVPSHPPRTHSPTHPDLDGVWARLQDADVPLVLHVGGGGRPLRPSFHENGRPKPTDFLGGGENVRSKDYMVLHNPPEMFVAAMVLDGVFEKFPRLMCGVIEQGALWVPALLRRIDIAQGTFKKSEPLLAELPMLASDYIRRQVRMTPFPTEPVGWLIEQAGEELFLFSSDYPHPEGTKDPLGRFEATLEGTDEAALRRFYSGNFAELFALSG